MTVAVSGGTGFIGRYVIEELLRRGIEVIVIGRDREKAATKPWFNEVVFIEADISKPLLPDAMQNLFSADKLLHLAWSGLPNYKSLFHFEENLLPQYFFIKNLLEAGLQDITITGTCFEYGKRNGCLSEDMLSNPENPYALAKDTLHRFLRELQQIKQFKLKWARLFYMYGEGQSASSILSQLNKAIENNEDHFNMSGGKQVRDYSDVKDIAAKLVTITLHDSYNGTINCCSGKGITVEKLVEDYLAEKKYQLRLNLGYYPYNDFEAFEFWGDNSKWKEVFE
jgi:dTDP-6-deoxy-L-talose 4-dehydrogenase (NAD+)